MSQEKLRDDIAGISGLIKDAITALVTHEGHKGVERMDNPLEANLKVSSTRQSTRN